MGHRTASWGGALVLSLGLFGTTHCASKATPVLAQCSVGSEGCACTPGGACDPGLSCLSKFCVDPNGGGSGSGGGNGNGSGGASGSTPDSGGPMYVPTNCSGTNTCCTSTADCGTIIMGACQPNLSGEAATKCAMAAAGGGGAGGAGGGTAGGGGAGGSGGGV